MKTTKKTFLSFFTLLLLFSGISYMQNLLWEGKDNRITESFQIPSLIPDGKKIKPILFGFDNLVADLYWIRLNQYIGENVNNEKKLLFPFLNLSTDLDPKFSKAYQTGIVMIPDEGNLDDVETLIEKSEHKNPNDWFTLFQSGGFYFFYREDYKTSIKYFQKCLQHKNCLPITPQIIQNLETRRGKYELVILQRLEELQNEKLSKDEYGLLQEKIIQASDLLFLNEASQGYEGEIKEVSDLKNILFTPKNQRIASVIYNLEKKEIINSGYDIQKTRVKIGKDIFSLSVTEEMLKSPYKKNPYKWSTEENRVQTERF